MRKGKAARSGITPPPLTVSFTAVMLFTFLFLFCRRSSFSPRDPNPPNCVMTSTGFLHRRDAQNGSKWLAPSGEKWQGIGMTRQQAPIRNPRKKRGRPLTSRMADEERSAIKQRIEDACNSLPVFYKDA